MAELPEARPVILLAVQVPILLVVLVGQGGPALAAPAAGDALVTTSPSSPCRHCHPTRQPGPIHPMGLQTSCFPCLLPCCRATAHTCHPPQGAAGVPALAGGAGTHGDTQGRHRHGEGGASTAGMCQPGHRHTEGRARLSQTCQTGHGQRELPNWSRARRGTHHPGQGRASLGGALPWVPQIGCRGLPWDCEVGGGRQEGCGGLFCRKVRPGVQWGLWISGVHRRVQGC